MPYSNEVYIVINKSTGQPTPYTNFDSAYGALCWLTGRQGTSKFKQDVKGYLKYFEVAHIFKVGHGHVDASLYKSEVYKRFE